MQREIKEGRDRMRITKRQLRRIIREEKARILAENRIRRIIRKRLIRELGLIDEVVDPNISAGDELEDADVDEVVDPALNELQGAAGA